MKFLILICLTVVTIASKCYGDSVTGLLLNTEEPIPLSQCPPYDDPNHIVMLPHSNDCRKYYTCLNGLAYAHQCPDNYYWSQLTYRCDLKQYSSCENNDFDPNFIQYSAYPGDCTRFYEKRLLRCPNNYHWNQLYSRCDLPHLAGCSASLNPYPLPTLSPLVPTAATPPAPTVQPSFNELIDPDSLCRSALQQPYLPYPGDCHKFIYCGSTASVLTCPTSLFWNRNTQSCGSTNIGCL